MGLAWARLGRGGFLLVPTLVYLAGLPMRRAVATSLVVIAVNSGGTFASHAARQAFPWRLGLVLLGCAMIGVTVGVALSHRTEPGRLKRYFACLPCLLGSWMLRRNL